MIRGIALAAAASFCASAAGAAPAGDRLRIIAVDVEGGAATLYVTPDGHSVLVDTGWPAGMGGPRPRDGEPPKPIASSAERIVAAARSAGVRRIDYLIVTHYHIDHVGGVADLMKLIPVGTVVDHGPNREQPPAGATPMQLSFSPATLYPRYEAAIAGHKRIVMKPHQTLAVGGLVLTAVNSDGAILSRPLPGAGKPGVGCDAVSTKEAIGGEENPRSLGFVASWGKARILALADTTWNLENRIVCPRDMVGPVDLMFSNNHGSALSNSPQLINTVAPTVVVINNGPTKGGDAESFDAFMASPRIKAVWQLHLATRSGAEKNAPPEQIANVSPDPDAMHPLSIEVALDGAVTLANPRTSGSVTYQKVSSAVR